MWPQAKEYQAPPEAGRTLSTAIGGSTTLPTHLSQTPGLQTVRESTSAVLSYQVCGNLVWQISTRKLIQYVCASILNMGFLCVPLISPIYFPGGSDNKASACNAGDLGSIPGLGRSPGKGNGNPLQYSCLENPMDQGALGGYSPWGCKESDTTEQLHFQSPQKPICNPLRVVWSLLNMLLSLLNNS